jgi:hypothetical protein
MAKSSPADRIADLEAELSRLRAEFQALRKNAPVLRPPLGLRLARTAVDPADDTYPEESDTPNTYPIIFLDGTYDQEAGDQAPEWTDRQSDALAVAQNIAPPGHYPSEGQIVAVWFDNGRWWFEYFRVSRRFKCLLNGALHKSDTSATIDGVTALDDNDYVPSPTSASNYLALDAPNDATGFITEIWSSGEATYILDALSNHFARIIYGTLGGTLGAGGSVSCTVTGGRDGVSPGSTVTVFSDESLFTGVLGKKFKAYYSPEDNKYYFLWVEGTC